MLAGGLVAMYSILNAGNPNSVLRPLFPDPSMDVYIALISSFLVFVLGFIVFFNKDREGFRYLIELNSSKIKALKKSGMKDQEIADEILQAMGSTHGFRHKMARKKLAVYLSEFQ